MSQPSNQQTINRKEEISLKESLLLIKKWFIHLTTKWLIITMTTILGAGIGFYVAYSKLPNYTATLSFALEDDKGSGGALSGAFGLASTLGIDLGTSAGGAFSGANFLELMKSRTLIEKALLNPVVVNNKTISIADYYIEFSKLTKKFEQIPKLKNISFKPLADRATFSVTQDSILASLYGSLLNTVSVTQKDKKVSFFYIEVKTTNDFFSKAFCESIAKSASEYYVDIKSKKAQMNVSILQKQVDSIRFELNAAISGVAAATDNTYNLNPAVNIKRVPSAKRQVDVQANTAILSQLVANLEIAKVTLLKETPLIQVIDRPIMPLKIEKIGRLKSLVIGGLIGGFLSVIFLIGARFFKTIF